MKYPQRPPRIQLFPKTRPFFFVTFNTADRRRSLANEQIHSCFLEFCQRAFEEHQVSVGRYVIMPDHIHLFVSLPDNGILLQHWVRALKTSLGKELLRVGEPKPHWQPGFSTMS